MPAHARAPRTRHTPAPAAPAPVMQPAAVSNASRLAELQATGSAQTAAPGTTSAGQSGGPQGNLPWWATARRATGRALGSARDAAGNALGSAGSLAGEVLTNAREAAASASMFRLGMDNRYPGPGADKTAYLSEAEAAHGYFDERKAAAEAYLAERGLNGTIVAKMVTADILNLGGGSPVEHAEWQLHMVPHEGEAPVQGEFDPANAPGRFDENELQAFVEAEGAKTEGSPILRSPDNPLFLGRLNYGTAGSGMYTQVPDYAEIGGHQYDTREVEMMTTVTTDQVSAAIDAMYDQQSRPYLGDGVCHQGAALAGQAFGLDPKDVASKVQSAWATRLKFGRTGKDGK